MESLERVNSESEKTLYMYMYNETEGYKPCITCGCNR